MIDFTLTQTSAAAVDTVFDAMTDHRAIADWVWACRRSTLDREGSPEPNGVGAVRRLVAVGPPFVEEIIAYQRPTRYAYKMLSGAPTRNHTGTVALREVATGTEVSWHVRSELKVPGVDRLLLPVFKKVIELLLKGVVDASEAATPGHDRPSRDRDVGERHYPRWAGWDFGRRRQPTGSGRAGRPEAGRPVGSGGRRLAKEPRRERRSSARSGRRARKCRRFAVGAYSRQLLWAADCQLLWR